MLRPMTTRWRRLALAALAASVLLAAWFVLVREPRRRLERAPPSAASSRAASGPMSIWPETPFDPADAVRRAQERVDAGADGWRRRPDRVVARFAMSIFGWPAVKLTGDLDVTAAPITVAVRARCPGGCAVAEPEPVGVTVDRLLGTGPGAIWSVVAVRSARLVLPVDAGDTVLAGDDLTFGLDLGPSRHAAVGVRYVPGLGQVRTSQCQGFAGRAGVSSSEIEIAVADPLFSAGDCTASTGAGYVFAYATPRSTVQTGDPLLEAASIDDLSIVPVRVAVEP
jgi:hypothetical protein